MLNLHTLEYGAEVFTYDGKVVCTLFCTNDSFYSLLTIDP